MAAIKRNRGYYMRMWRAHRDMTGGEAGAYFGIRQSHWSLIESGRREASPQLAARLAKALKQPMDLFCLPVPK